MLGVALAAACATPPDTLEERYLATVRARACLESGDVDAARDLLESLASDLSDAEAWTNLGTVEMRRGERERAEHAWERAVRRDAGCARAHYLLGASRFERGRETRERARSGGRHAAERQKQGAELLASAVEALTAAAGADPTNPAIHELLAAVHETLGAGEAAARVRAEARRLDPHGLGAGAAQAALRGIELPPRPLPASAAPMSVSFEAEPLAVRALGVQAVDVDGDGRHELVLHGDGSVLRHESVPGQAHGRWSPWGAASPDSVVGFTVAGLLDGDGRDDLLVCAVERAAAPAPAARRRGAAPSPEAAGRTRVALLSGGARAATPLFEVPYEVRAARAADLDVDGDLDLVVATAAAPSLRVWRNDGRGGFDPEARFEGLQSAPRLLALTCGDFDANGRPDLVCADERGRLLVLAQQDDGRFVDLSAAAGLNQEVARVVEAFDLDADGATDLLLGNDAGLWLFANRGGARFVRQAAYRVPQSRWSNQRPRGVSVAGLRVLDLDNDGLQDVVSLHHDREVVAPALLAAGPDAAAGAAPIEDTTPEPPPSALQPQTAPVSLCIWRNEGAGVLLEESERANVDSEPLLAALPAADDLDGDGDLDLVVVRADSLVQVHWNEGGNAQRRLLVELQGRRGPASGHGAHVELYVGAMAQRFQVQDRLLWVGVGAAQRLDAVRVVWPDRVVENWLDVELPADGRLRLRRGAPGG